MNMFALSDAALGGGGSQTRVYWSWYPPPHPQTTKYPKVFNKEEVFNKDLDVLGQTFDLSTEYKIG